MIATGLPFNLAKSGVPFTNVAPWAGAARSAVPRPAIAAKRRAFMGGRVARTKTGDRSCHQSLRTVLRGEGLEGVAARGLACHASAWLRRHARSHRYHEGRDSYPQPRPLAKVAGGGRSAAGHEPAKSDAGRQRCSLAGTGRQGGLVWSQRRAQALIEAGPRGRGLALRQPHSPRQKSLPPHVWYTEVSIPPHVWYIKVSIPPHVWYA